MATCSETLLEDEIAVLQSIYLPDELEVINSDRGLHEIKVMLHPYTADNDDERFVCMQLVIKLDKKYPQSKPKFEIKMPRGISDAQLESILTNLNSLASKRIGEEMMFVLIEYAKECLTNNNRPECPCPICLELFEEDDEFTKSECFHYFHGACMARYVTSCTAEQKEDTDKEVMEKSKDSQNVIPCPICRADIDTRNMKIDSPDSKSKDDEEIVFQPSEKFLSWRKQMRKIFLRQQKRGGIIDVEAEKNKFLIATKKTEEKTVPEETIQDNNWTSGSGTQILMNIDHWTNDGVERKTLDTTKTRSSGGKVLSGCNRNNVDSICKPSNRNVTGKEPCRSSSPDRYFEKDSTRTKKHDSLYNERLKCSDGSVARNEQFKRHGQGKSRVLSSGQPEAKSTKSQDSFPNSGRKKTVKPPPGFKPIN